MIPTRSIRSVRGVSLALLASLFAYSPNPASAGSSCGPDDALDAARNRVSEWRHSYANESESPFRNTKFAIFKESLTRYHVLVTLEDHSGNAYAGVFKVRKSDCRFLDPRAGEALMNLKN